MHDIVIRGGTIIDGTGKPRYSADVAVDDGRISAVGPVASQGKREIDATDRLVMPGWVDCHTHYDGQATWDADMTPSAWHGVTSVVMGNCGVGFAPAKADHAWENTPGNPQQEIDYRQNFSEVFPMKPIHFGRKRSFKIKDP